MAQQLRSCLLAATLLMVAATALAGVPPYCGTTKPNTFPPVPNGYHLMNALVLTRHGDRTVAHADPCWPSDNVVWSCNLTFASVPNSLPDSYSASVPRLFRKKYMKGRNFFPGTCMTGQLTTKGYDQQLGNGAMFRQAYINTGLVSSVFNSTTVFVRADDVPRVIQSVQGAMSGLYPPGQPGQPVSIMDVHTMDIKEENLFPNNDLCPKLKKYYGQRFFSSRYLQHYEAVTVPLMNEINAQLGTDYIDRENLEHFHDCVNVHMCHGFASPITNATYVKLEAEVSWQREYEYTYPSRTAWSQVGIGFLIQEIFEAQRAVRDGKSAIRLGVIAGHDTTLMPLLAALDVWSQTNLQWPPYAAHMSFELLRDSQANYFVRLLYYDLVMKIPGCTSAGGTLCSWDEWTAIVSTLAPTNPPDCKFDQIHIPGCN